jgi:hypothetical protein
LWIEAEKNSFALTCDIFAGIVFTYLLLYFFSTNGFKGIADSINNTRKAMGGKNMTKEGHQLLEDD